jgi:uncharacterized protein (TIGR03086 family)
VSESSRWFVKALYSMDHVVRLVDATSWDAPSPCEGWSARHVLGHVVAMQHYFTACIDGRPPPMDPMTEPDRHAGERPAAAWAEARDAVLEAIDRPGVLDEVVDTMADPVRVDDLIRFNVVDTTVHSWDLARAAGVDDRLDPGLLGRCLVLLGEAGAGDASPPALGFGPPVGAQAADDQATLLALTGRRA